MVIKKRYIFLFISLISITFSCLIVPSKAYHVGHAACFQARKYYAGDYWLAFRLWGVGGGETTWSSYFEGYYFYSHFYYYDADETLFPNTEYIGEYKCQLISESVVYYKIKSYILYFDYTVSGRFYEKDNPNDYCDITIWIQLEAWDSWDTSDWEITYDASHLSNPGDWDFDEFEY